MIPIRDINPTRITPVLTIAIIIVATLVFVVTQPQDDTEAVRFLYERAAIACELTTGEPLEVREINQDVCLDEPGGSAVPFPDKNVWLAAVVSMFLHGGWAHLIFNMWALWIFGNNIEESFGRLGYLALYGIGGVVATLGFVAANPDATVPLVGASGAIAAVMGAYAVLFPGHQVLTLFWFWIVPIPAAAFLLIWFFAQFAFIGEGSGIAWEAHVAGFIFGIVVALALRRFLLRRAGTADDSAPSLFR